MLGYSFKDPDLRTIALTHRSAGQPNNERLEFLGDAILSGQIAEILFRKDPTAREGALTRTRASLVRKESLAAIARNIGLGKVLILGGGERHSGGRERDSILADALEALIGAVFIDGGVDATHCLVKNLFRVRLDELSTAEVHKDAKTDLQERLQHAHLALPTYEVRDVSGAANEQKFTVECRVDELDLSAIAEGANRRQAEQIAAQRVLTEFDAIDGYGASSDTAFLPT